MSIDMVKRHLKVTHSFEDELIQDYIEWAKDDVRSSVSLSKDVDEEYLESNMQFKKAVTLLSSFYFDQRLVITDKKFIEMPYGVLDAIQKLRGDPNVD